MSSPYCSDTPRYSVTFTRRAGAGVARAWEGSRRPGTSSADGNSFSWGGSSNHGSSLQMTFLGVRLDIAPEPGAPEPEMLAAD